MQYKTKGTCSQVIQFDVVDDKVHDVAFLGGCSGNLQGIGILIEGMPVDEVIAKLQGINCKSKGTSCPDQLAKALIQYKQEQVK